MRTGGLACRVVRWQVLLVTLRHLGLGRVSIVEIIGVILINEVFLFVVVLHLEVHFFICSILDAIFFKVVLLIRAELILRLLLLLLLAHLLMSLLLKSRSMHLLSHTSKIKTKKVSKL